MGSSQKLLQDPTAGPHTVNLFSVHKKLSSLFVQEKLVVIINNSNYFYRQELLRGEDWHLLCLVGFLHENAHLGCCCWDRLFHLRVLYPGHQHLEVLQTIYFCLMILNIKENAL